MVSHQQEDRYARRRDAKEAAGKLPLVSLGRVAALVGVASQQHQVHAVGERIVHNLVQGSQEVAQARRQPGSRVQPPIIFDADMQVGEMEDSH